MKQKGFTLIELLAVIVILAIIALIATPIVLNIIEDARKSSFKSTCEIVYDQSSIYQAGEYLKGTETSCSVFEFNSNRTTTEIIDGIAYEPINKLRLENAPKNGTYKICQNQRELIIDNGSYTCVRTPTKIQILNGTVEENDLTEPIINDITLQSTANTITIIVDATETDGSIKKYYYTVNDKTYESENNIYTVDGLDKLTNYSVKVEVENASGLKSTITKTIETTDVGSITFDKIEEDTETEYEYSSSETVKVTYPEINNGEYYIKTSVATEVEEGKVKEVCGTDTDPTNCEEVVTTILQPNTWYKVTDTTIEVTLKENGTIYVKVEDGNTISTSSSITVSNIDSTVPTLEIGEIEKTTKTLTIPFIASDSESGITKTICEYGADLTLGETGTIEDNKCIISGLKDSKDYYYKITTTNGSGLETFVTGNSETGAFGTVSISASDPEDWTTSKTITVTGVTTGATLQYQLGTTTGDWTPITSGGTFTLEENTTIYARLYDGKNETSPVSLTITKIDTAVPSVTLGTITKTTKSITIPITATDSQSKIKSVSCVYGTSTSYGSTGTVTGNETDGYSCTISNLTTGSTYYYKVTATDNTNRTNTATGNSETGSFGQVSISASDPEDWTTSKTITVTGVTTGATLQYQLGTTTGDWTPITSGGTFTLEENTTIYARLYDGKNETSPVSLTVTKIDTSSPTVTLGTLEKTTKSITIPITATDSQSKIKSVSCVYGTSTSYGSTGTVTGNETDGYSCTISNLTTGSTYYYKVTATDNTNRTNTATGNSETGSFGQVSISASDQDSWTTSKTITVTGVTTGATLQYQLGTTTGDWTPITSGGTFTLEENTTIYARLYDGKNETSPVSLTITKIDTAVPSVTLGTITKTTKSITIPITATDTQSKIKSVSCVYGTSTSYGSTGTVTGSESAGYSCTISDLTTGGTYYYKVTATDNTNRSTDQTGNSDTGTFGTVSISASDPEDWTTSKTITVTGTTTGATLQYRVGSTGTWTPITSGGTFTLETNTTIYAKLTDGKNETSPTSLTVTKIDTTAPSVTLGTLTKTTKSITIPITATDSQSKIKSVTCVYGTSTSYGSTGTVTGNETDGYECVLSNLTTGSTYYYKVTATDNTNRSTDQTGNSDTGTFGTVSISASDPEDWTTSKTITVTGTTTGATLQYRVGSTGTWTPITSGGTFTLETNTTIYAKLTDGKNETSPTSLTVTKIDTSAPSLTLGTLTKTTKSITIPITATDSQSKIKSVSCVYGTSTSYGSSGTVTGNETDGYSCVLPNLTTGQTYQFKVTATDNTNRSTNKTGNSGTGSFGTVSISASDPEDWTTSKTITVTGTTTGATLQYRVGSTGTWTPITSGGTFTLEENTTIYAKLTDGKNETSPASLTVTKIDTAVPSVILGTVTSTSNTIAIPITATDSQSKVSSVTCVYGTSTSYGSSGTVTGNETDGYSCVISGLTGYTTYYYKVTAIDNTNRQTTKTGSKRTLHSFADDTWETIANNTTTGVYSVGEEKEVLVGGISYTVRIANMSTPDACSGTSYSQTACGFVVEFVDLFSGKMYETSPATVSWNVSDLRTYLNQTFYNYLPSDLQSVIIDTSVYSGGMSTVTNSPSKLYILSPHEVWEVTGTETTYKDIATGDKAYNFTHQLDYYKNNGVTTSENVEFTIKSYASTGTTASWYLRSVLWNFSPGYYFYAVNSSGTPFYTNASAGRGVAPAFRIG